jgi:alpha-L-rhamnosidase
VIDDQEAFDALLAAFRAHDEVKTREFLAQTRWLPHLPLSHGLEKVPREIREDIRAALETVSRGRAG